MEMVRLCGDKLERIERLKKLGFERQDAVKIAEALEGRQAAWGEMGEILEKKGVLQP